LPTYTWDDVAKHTSEDDCWVVVNDRVLDVTDWIPDHPGGKMVLIQNAGKDASVQFNMIHPPDAPEKFAAYTIKGRIEGASVRSCL
tara:strand:- start:3088 stop:3345 length:258 start_codon:yes stop_codon:yes gene_type:complete